MLLLGRGGFWENKPGISGPGEFYYIPIGKHNRTKIAFWSFLGMCNNDDFGFW